MPDPSSAGNDKTGPAKKPVSPARNAVGVVVLIAVLAVGWIQYSARSAHNAAVNALNERTQDETKGLMTVSEAEKLIAKPADGPGVDVKEVNATYTKQTYTWSGLLKSYTLTAYYTKGAEPGLHHFESEGAKYTPETPAAVPVPAVSQRGTAKGGGRPKPATDSDAKSPDPSAAKTQTAPSATNKTEPADATPKAATTPAPIDAGATKPADASPKPDSKPAPVPGKGPN
jgi:hypothetical protein